MQYTDNHDLFLEMERRFQEDRDFCAEWAIKVPTFAGEAMRLMQHLDQDLRRLKFLTVNQTNIVAAVSGAPNPLVHQIFNNPDKNIMGKKVGGDRKPIQPAATMPTKTKQAKFVAEVADLYAGFPGLSNQDVANILSKPEGATLIRGVAKISDTPGWDSRDASELNFGFFDLIRESIATKESGKNLIAGLEEQVDSIEDADDIEYAEEVVEPGAKKPAKNRAKGTGAFNPLVKKGPLDDE